MLVYQRVYIYIYTYIYIFMGSEGTLHFHAYLIIPVFQELAPSDGSKWLHLFANQSHKKNRTKGVHQN